MLSLERFDSNNSPLSDVVLSSASYGDEPFLAELFNEPDEEKLRFKFIHTNIEPIIRKSNEYKRWTYFIKQTLSTNFVCYHTGSDSEICSLEIHHHPYTLYSLCDIVMRSCTKYTTFDIAKYVMQLHYSNLVGFVPLCKTSHEKYHNGVLSIPVDVVEGNWRDLKKFITIPDDIECDIEAKSRYTLDNVNDKWVVDHTSYELRKDDRS